MCFDLCWPLTPGSPPPDSPTPSGDGERDDLQGFNPDPGASSPLALDGEIGPRGPIFRNYHHSLTGLFIPYCQS